jgi:hypothetical protein
LLERTGQINSFALPYAPFPTGEQLIATILKHDTKATSSRIALAYPGVTGHVAVPLKRTAEL